MSDQLTPDLCIIGDSAAGLRAALLAGAFGVPTVLVKSGRTIYGMEEARHALLAAADMAATARQAAQFGIQTGVVSADCANVMAHVRAVQARAALRCATARYRALGIHVVESDPVFESTSVLRAGAVRIAARRFIIAQPNAPYRPALPGLGDVPTLTEETIFTLQDWPRRLAVLGNDGEALEWAQALQRLGSAVTLVAATSLLPRADPEQAAIVTNALRREGVDFKEAHVTAVDAGPRPGSIRLMLEENGTAGVYDADALLLTGQGRTDLTGLGLATAGIGSSEAGIKVDHRLRTDNPRIFAIGPCAATGGPIGHHAALVQADCVMRQILFRLTTRYDPRRLPRAVQTHPASASAGLNEAEARAQHGSIAVLRSAFANNDLAIAAEQTAGHAKILLDRRGRLIGISLTGPQAAELIGPWAAALGGKTGALRNMVPPVPSYAETPRRALLESLAPLARNKLLRKLSTWLRRFG